MTTVTGRGPEQMALLAARIRQADPVLQRQLRARMKDAAGPVVDAVKASILAMPSHHAGHLRDDVAKTVTARVSFLKTGVRLDITSNGARMPQGQGNMPALIDSATGWGHPVFLRHRTLRQRKHWTWVRQRGKPGWFEQPISDKAPDLRAAVEAAMDATARQAGG